MKGPLTVKERLEVIKSREPKDIDAECEQPPKKAGKKSTLNFLVISTVPKVVDEATKSMSFTLSKFRKQARAQEK